MGHPETPSPPHDGKIELRPDGWGRFERAVDAAVKGGPKHRITPKAKERAASKGRIHKGKTRA